MSCSKCGNGRQIWVNQISKKLTCHRVGCSHNEDITIGDQKCPALKSRVGLGGKFMNFILKNAIKK